ncbi:hypothetical protein D3C73_1479630 [compost metagenome]
MKIRPSQNIGTQAPISENTLEIWSMIDSFRVAAMIPTGIATRMAIKMLNRVSSIVAGNREAKSLATGCPVWYAFPRSP